MENIILTAVIAFLSAWSAAWYGVKLATKSAEQSQRKFLEHADKIAQSLNAIARRQPGGSGYAAVKDAEQRYLEKKESDDRSKQSP